MSAGPWGREARPLRVATAIGTVLVVLSPSRAYPQGESPVEAPTVRVLADPVEERSEDPTGAVDVIDVDDAPLGSTVADLVDELPGVRVRRLGGLEAYATVSIRGSTAAQVLVLRDGVPLASASAAEVNLAELPLDQIERIEVYRGPSAAHFGSGGLGGVVNLVSRAEARQGGARFDLGLGSFMPGSFDLGRALSFSAQRRVGAQATARLGRFSLLAASSILQTDGDFTFLDDNGTLWEEDDDSFARRRNNDASQADAMVRATGTVGRVGRLTVTEVASTRSQGSAGYGTALAEEARLRTTQSLTAFELDRASTGSRVPTVRARLSARLRRDEWEDRLGEIGVGREHDDDLTVDVTARTTLGWPLPMGAGSLWLQGELRNEQFLSRSVIGEGERWGWRRTSGALGGWVTWSLAGGLVELVPQLRLEATDDAPTGSGPTVAGGEEPEGSTRLFSSEQLGVVANPLSWLRLRLGAGFTQRPPTFLELLGNRGTIAGNPLLRPESGWTVDAGLRARARGPGPLVAGRLEVTGFYRFVDDLIQLVPNSQVTFVATNVGAARVAGVEAAGDVKVDWASAARSRWPGFVTLRAGLTFTDSVDASDRAFLEGRQLPLRPRWEVFARLAVSWGVVELSYELDYLSGNYLDPYNSFPIPHRLLHAAELSADLRRWSAPRITLSARNLADRITETIPVRGIGDRRRPVADVAGFPLPGLTVFLSLRWDVPRS